MVDPGIGFCKCHPSRPAVGDVLIKHFKACEDFLPHKFGRKQEALRLVAPSFLLPIELCRVRCISIATRDRCDLTRPFYASERHALIGQPVQHFE